MAADMDPSDVVTLLGEYQSKFIPLLLKRNGSIDKFLGDGIMATFGAVEQSDTYAADAMRAIDDIMRISDEWAAERRARGVPPLAINASVAAGPIVFGAIGDEERLEYTVIGASVNLSAKLEKHNKELGVRALTTEYAYQTALEQGYEDQRSRQSVTTQIGDLKDIHKLIILEDQA